MQNIWNFANCNIIILHKKTIKITKSYEIEIISPQKFDKFNNNIKKNV